MSVLASARRSLRAGPVTRLGWSVALLAPVCWVAAWLTGWEELAVAAGTLLALVVLASLFAIGRSDYEVELMLDPQRVGVDDPSHCVLVVRNAGSRASLPASVELGVGEAVHALRVPALASGSEHRDQFAAPTDKRAVITIGPASTVRGDPAGLIRRVHRWTSSIDLFVHPRLAPLDRLGSGFLRDLEGQTTQDLSPSDVAFHTLREYVPGDDLRHIHWKTTARIGTLMVRQFVDTRRSLLAVLLSTDAAEFAGETEFELAVSMAASIGVRSLRDGQTVRAVVGEHEIPSSTPVALLDAAAGITARDGAGGLVRTVSRANRVAADASLVVAVTGSSVPLDEVRATVGRLKSDGVVLVLRADLNGGSETRSLGDLILFNVPTLDEFGRLMFQASRS